MRADPLWVENPARRRPSRPLQVRAFSLHDVRLLDGPFQHAQELDRQYLLSLDPDRLLHTFRVNAGLPSSAKPLGGWEEPKCELRGHFVGHYLSACALMYASTGDERLKAEGRRRRGRTGRVPGEARQRLPERLSRGVLRPRRSAASRVWAPYYTLHKIYAGLLDMYVYCDNAQALEVVPGSSPTGSSPATRKLTDEQMQTMLGNEHGGMNEVLANLYGLTGDEKYLKHRPAVQSPWPSSVRRRSGRTSSPACTPTRRSPSSSAPPGSTN